MNGPTSRSDVSASATPFLADSAIGLGSTVLGQADDGRQPIARLVRSARLRELTRLTLHEAAAPVAVAVAYYVSCLVGFALRYPSSGISFFWPPNAVLLTALLVIARRRWPALIVAAFVAHGLAHAEDGTPALAWSVQYVGNASQALLGALIMQRFDAVTMHQDSRRSLVFIVGACIIAPAVASLTPAYVYVSLGWASDFFAAWRARAVSNAAATMALVPSLLVLWRYTVHKPVLRTWRVVEFVGLLVGLAATHTVASALSRSGILGLSVALSAITPFLIWAAVRFGGAGLSFALSAALLMMSQVATHLEVVAFGVPADLIVGVQLLFISVAVPLSLLAGLLQQERTEYRALVDVEHQNRAILRALPDTILLHTKDGAILQSYPRRVDDPAMAGRPAVDPISPNVIASVVTTPLAPDGEEPHVHEYTAGTDGTTRKYEARSVAVDGERAVTMIRDVTERWRSEQALLESQRRYTLALSTGGIGVWDYDVATGHLHVDGPLRTILGYGEAEVSDTVSDWQMVVYEPDRDDATARFAALVTGAARNFETEFRVVHKDGSLRWISSRGTVTHTGDGRPSRIVGTYVDITERKDAARALTDVTDRLTRVGRIEAMSELTASLAHELGQPLGAISANVEASLRELDSQRQPALSQALEDVLRESRRASWIIERTRQLFQNRPAQPVTRDLNDIVREVARIAGPRLRELHVRVQLVLASAIPQVHVDEVQMQQVLLNLVLNAADAVHDVDLNRRVIRISTRPTKRHVIVSVRDSGVGLDQTDRTRLFEPFYSTKATGTGMGLAISQSIVRSHGGTLWGISNRDGGSTFRFKIPLRAGNVPQDSSRVRNVLVVDDNRGLRESLKRLLRSHGYHVAVAANGARAVALTETFRPDALVIDMSLGDMTGLDLVKRLRAIPVNRPLLLIALTAYQDDDLRAACIAAGFDGYLVKQTQISELPVLLEQHRR